jgi:hypothetical protein
MWLGESILLLACGLVGLGYIEKADTCPFSHRWSTVTILHYFVGGVDKRLATPNPR